MHSSYLRHLVKRLEISKELIHECVTVPGCCCCMPHLMDSCSYVHKNTLLAAKGGCTYPPKSATDSLWESPHISH